MKQFFLSNLIILALLSLSVNSFGQNCEKFVNYQNKTIDTKGINLRVFGQPVGVGATNVSPIMREASDKLQKLDLLQYNICEQLKNIKTDFMREKLQAQYTNLLMQMMQLLKEDAGQTDQNDSDVTNPESEKAKKADDTPAPNPVPKPDDFNMDVDITFPCEDFSISPAGVIRGFGMETSMDAQIARRAARTVALEELASKIEITVKSTTSDYFLRTQHGLTEEIEKRIEGRTETSVNQVIRGYKSVCERTTQNKQTLRYSSYIAIEINEDDALKPIYDELIKDPDLRRALPTFVNFKTAFNELKKTLESSF